MLKYCANSESSKTVTEIKLACLFALILGLPLLTCSSFIRG